MDLIRKLLEKNTIKRLNKFDDIKKHSFFKGINFDDLENLNIKPPYKPKITKKYHLKEALPIDNVVKYLSDNRKDTSENGKKLRLAKDWDQFFVL